MPLLGNFSCFVTVNLEVLRNNCSQQRIQFVISSKFSKCRSTPKIWLEEITSYSNVRRLLSLPLSCDLMKVCRIPLKHLRTG